MRSRGSMEVVVMVMVVVVVMVGRVDGGRREKRYLYINPSAPFTLGFLINTPISLALPTLAPKTGRAMQDVGLWGAAAGGRGDAEAESNFRSQHPRPEELVWDPAYVENLVRLTAYFTHLQLPTLPCQERLLCELSSEPEAFDPISQIFLKELRMLYGPVDTSQESLIWRYMKASREGLDAPLRDCAVIYSTCPLSAERILNMPLLRLWQYVASMLNMQVF
ncbi:uncharacterized protein LOC126982965 [Eriocheir sinensis]|uniref:uncharacterized protein LOC126982965 n=1 Tax=Eriocheir sinensis TaxID=95602 RepID=UPI0021CA20B4|nr:uncharacterized protein LOC126982965 [Eriocheir sinensis]